MERIAFTRRPVPIPADYRPLYRIGQLLLVLKLNCRSSTGSLLKLHLFHWSLKNERNRNVLRELVANGRSSSLVIWGFDPALNRALHFALSEEVCQLHDGKYTLTAKGDRLAVAFLEQDVYQAEKEFLREIGKNVSEKAITTFTQTWIKPNVEN